MTAIEMIDKRFKVISAFELQTRNQLDWFVLQFKKMLTHYRSSYFNQMIENRSICCLLKDWYRKHNELTLTMMKKWEDWKKLTRHSIFLKEFFSLKRECLRCFRRSSFELIFNHLIVAQVANRLADAYLFASH